MKKAGIILLVIVIIFSGFGCAGNNNLETEQADVMSPGELLAEMGKQDIDIEATIKPSDETENVAEEVVEEYVYQRGESKYIGNKNSKKFHIYYCSYLPAEHNREYFSEREEAINLGYVPCKRCNP